MTYVAPQERASAAEVAADYQRLRETQLIQQLLDSFPEAAMVLNSERQIVLANDKLANLLKIDSTKLLGSRPGEVLNCVHAWDCRSGCGTSKFCSQCGAGRAIWECSTTKTAQVEECRITCASAEGPISLDLRVWTTQFVHERRRFTVFAARDTTDEKRRAVLERLFFHDVLNTAGGLKGLIEVWPDLAADEAAAMRPIAQSLAEELVEEIRSHRDLTAAEQGDLVPIFKEVDAGRLLMRLCMSYSHHTVAAGKMVAAPILSGERKICTDEVILSRVLRNLLKNALEASSAGQTIDVAFHDSPVPMFSIHNESVMPQSVQLQVFQRSFSTKEERGRGLGTYSVKLLVERYLKGTVAFNSSAERGTTFTVTLGVPANPATG